MTINTRAPKAPNGPEPTHSRWEVPAFDVPRWGGRAHPWCVIIPVLNEGKRIQRLLSRMSALAVSQMADILIVDGGSTDRSLPDAMLVENHVKGLLIKRGAGKLSAQLRCGYAFALNEGYEGIVTIDGNDKDDPLGIPKIIEALTRDVDFVQASRFVEGGVAENTPFLRDLAIRCVHAPMLRWCSRFHWTDTTQGFRGYSRRLLMDHRVAPFRDVFQTYELLAYLSYRAPRLGFRCEEIPSARRYPITGKVPTKISSFAGNWSIFKILIAACLGRFNPN